MNRWRCVLALGLVVTANAALADGPRISGDELKTLFSGAKNYGTTKRGVAFISQFHPDGTAEAAVGIEFSDTGRWELKDDGYCAAWQKIRNGRQACFDVIHHKDDDYHFISVDGIGRSQDAKILK